MGREKAQKLHETLGIREKLCLPLLEASQYICQSERIFLLRNDEHEMLEHEGGNVSLDVE